MITKRILLSVISLIVIYSCTSSNKTSQERGPVVGNVAGENIYLKDLKAQFYKSSVRPDDNITPQEKAQELAEFLPLYLDYRAKLASAREAGYFNDPEILEELSQYEKQTAFPYWLENKVRDQLLSELEERSKYQINGSHILITIPQNPSVSDTLRAYNRLIEARNKALAGEDFDSLSVVYSSTQQGRSVGGNLGFFSAGWAVKEFEDVAYNMVPGEISKPFRTQFGYHILKVNEIKESQPDRHVSHAFFRLMREEDMDEVIEMASQILQEMNEGAYDWTTMVATHSQDGQSAPMDGRIGWVNMGRYDARFTEPIMAMKNPGDIIGPFFSGYGVHIVRLDSIRTYTSDEQRREELLTQLQGLPRYRENRQFTTKSVRDAGREFIDTRVLEALETEIYKNGDAPFAEINWSEELLNSRFYRIADNWYTANDYLEWLFTQFDANSTTNYHYTYREQFYNDRAERHIIPITKDVFPAFADLSREYLNGLVIFKISEDSVWNFAKEDTIALREIYDNDPDRFRFEDRYFYYRISAGADSLIEKAIEAYKNGVKIDSLRAVVGNIVVRADVINTLDQEPYSYLSGLSAGDVSEVFDFRNRRTILILDRVDPSRTMSFDEAFFRVVSEYQPIREEQWLQRIRNKFNLTAFPERITPETLASD